MVEREREGGSQLTPQVEILQIWVQILDLTPTSCWTSSKQLNLCISLGFFFFSESRIIITLVAQRCYEETRYSHEILGVSFK